VADTQFQQWADRPGRPEVDARSLWFGGVATALVAALVAVVGVLVVRGVLAIPVIAPGNTNGVIDYVGAVWVAGFAIVGGLLATALAHVLLLYAPRPLAFLGWIIGLVALAFAIWPFTVHVKTDVRLANAALYLVIGIAIGIQLTGTASQAMRRRVRG
jgi:uncharacterized protein DUF6069